MADTRQLLSVHELAAEHRRRDVLHVVGMLVVVAIFAGLLFITTSPDMPLILMLLLFGLSTLVVIWREPVVAVYLILSTTLIFEQWPIRGIEPITSRAPFFQTISGAFGVPVPVSPAEIILLFSLAAVVLQSVGRRRTELYLGKLFVPMVLFLTMVVASFIYGVVADPLTPDFRSAFSLNAAWAETRSFFYLFIAYLLAGSLVNDGRRLKTFVWIMIAAIGLKGVQGINSFLVERRHDWDLQTIVAHEDVVFFSTFLLLLSGMYLYGGDHRQRVFMLVLLLPVTFTLFATTRRMAFIVLAVGFIVLGYSLWRTRPQLFKKVAPVVTALLLIYTAAFWTQPDTLLGQPVRAFKSQIGYTSPRDAQSDLWRDLENHNIASNIRDAPIAGLGFGREYRLYVEQPTLDGTGFIYWVYITHNAIFWIWMKMGVFGFLAFWWLFGSAIVLGLILFRTLNDAYLKTLALVIACLTIMQIMFSYGDLGLTYARSMIFLGLLLGVLVRLPSIDQQSRDETSAEVERPPDYSDTPADRQNR